MARPLKCTIDYFPHLVNSGKTILILQNEFGNDGYAFWFKLLSLLCKTDGQVYDYNNPASFKLLLAETLVSEDIANRILQLLANIEAIDPKLYQHKIIWVQHLVNNLEDVYRRRTKGSKPMKPVIVNKNKVNVNNNNPPSPLSPHTPHTPYPPETKLDKTKLDKTKQKIYGEFKNVFLTDVEYQKLEAKFNTRVPEIIEELSSGIESKGYKYKSHYAAILSWQRRKEANGGKLGKGKDRRLPKEYTPAPTYDE